MSSPSNPTRANGPTESVGSNALVFCPPGSGRCGLFFCFERLLSNLVLPLAQPAFLHLLEGRALVVPVAQHGLLAREVLPAGDNDVDVLRVQLEAQAPAPSQLGRHQGGAATAERLGYELLLDRRGH